MPDTLTLRLFDGELQAPQTVSADGTVTYRLDGVHMHGTITFTPHLRAGQAVPDRLVIRCGAGQHLLADRLHDLPVVNGVTLVGGADQLDLTDHNWAERLQLTPRDAVSSVLAVQAVWYAREVCRHLAAHYRRLDIPSLHAAAARHSAGRRLADCVHQQIRPAHALWTEVGGELAAAQQLAAELQHLSALRLLPTPTCSRAEALDGVYISSDDDGDWLTCPRCDQPTAPITPGAGLTGLLAWHAEHRCPPRTP
ncbi:hypothetical protein [Actinoplanes sp. RD1]|uniref:hypothetical protein n=1 Tax=Actinoplanes sp. RD1 TaxID=3064538 RepID=UPI0027428598|nr:hypothetical protein [Actinoplanes sp. RD1]